MKSRAMSSAERGFSIAEVLVTVGILLVLVVAALPLTGSFYPRVRTEEEARKTAELVRSARIRAIARLRDSWHGVRVDTLSNPPRYILYEGTAPVPSFAARNSAFDVVIPAPAGMAVSTTLPADGVVFARGTGASNIVVAADVVVSGGGSQSEVTIYPSGLVEVQ